jgi:hypothetical protein
VCVLHEKHNLTEANGWCELERVVEHSQNSGKDSKAPLQVSTN